MQTLERAKASGELSFEDLSGAVDLSLECIASAGFHAERNATDNSQGFPMVSYFYEGPETGNPVADRCIHENSEAIEAIYQLQPGSVEAAQAHLKDVADDFAECLKAEGIDANFDGLEGEELVKAVHHYDSEQALAALESGVPPRCMSEASY